MTDPTDRFCFHAIFAIEALKALEAGCPADDTEFAGEINVAIGLRQMLEVAVNSYGLPIPTQGRQSAAKSALDVCFRFVLKNEKWLAPHAEKGENHAS